MLCFRLTRLPDQANFAHSSRQIHPSGDIRESIRSRHVCERTQRWLKAMPPERIRLQTDDFCGARHSLQFVSAILSSRGSKVLPQTQQQFGLAKRQAEFAGNVPTVESLLGQRDNLVFLIQPRPALRFH